MSVLEATITDPDKLGLLIQCRQKMDELNPQQLNNYIDSALGLLSIKEVKQLLFVGLNTMKRDISYNTLFQMKTCINTMVEKIRKQKEIKKKSKPTPHNASKPIFIVPNNASFSKTISFDIISNNICTFLKMSSIVQIACCDRKLAIVAHTPTSIKHLAHRYDPYRYTVNKIDDALLDGHYYHMENWDICDIHRFKNVETLSISVKFFDNYLSEFNLFKKVKHLSFYSENANAYELNYDYDAMKLLPQLQSLSFVNNNDFVTVLQFLKQYRIQNEIYYYHPIIYQLHFIAFVDCWFKTSLSDDYADDCDQYGNIVNFILPSQPNKLEILKLENSFFMKTDDAVDAEYKKIDEEFENVDRIKESLTNLKGFVYGQFVEHNLVSEGADNLFLVLSRNILNNLSSFKKLESLHTHSYDTQLLPQYLHNPDNQNVLNHITELCVTVSMNIPSTSWLHSIDTLLPNLEKLCLVIHISDDDGKYVSNFQTRIAYIFRNQNKLKIFQIVAVMNEDIYGEEEADPTFCLKKINIVSTFIQKMVLSLTSIRNCIGYSKLISKQPLLFKFHIKSSHLLKAARCSLSGSSRKEQLVTFVNAIQNMVINYLGIYPLGKIQVKISWNTNAHDVITWTLDNYIKVLSTFLRMDVKKLDRNDIDFNQYAISATKKDINEDIHHENRWKVDCRYCCNTAWV